MMVEKTCDCCGKEIPRERSVLLSLRHPDLDLPFFGQIAPSISCDMQDQELCYNCTKLLNDHYKAMKRSLRSRRRREPVGGLTILILKGKED